VHAAALRSRNTSDAMVAVVTSRVAVVMMDNRTMNFDDWLMKHRRNHFSLADQEELEL
jgi:hypothetical protein